MPTWKRVFFDDFPAGSDVSREKWWSPVWSADHNPAYIPRTGFRNNDDFDPPIGRVPCTSQNGADLRLSTYNPKAADSFLGSCIYTQDKWGGTGETVRFEATVKCTAMPGGAVASVFAYALCTGRYVQNEIDFEFASNHWGAPPSQQFFTNVFVCASGSGSGPEVQNTGDNLLDWHTFSLIYTPSKSVEWHIDGKSVRIETEHVPVWKASEGMHLYLNFWAPAKGWDWAYNAGIDTTGEKDEQEWHYYVKSAAVYYGT